jgi:D-3-phosphoglycerate dehydrogenase
MDRGWIMGKTSLDKSKIKFLLLEGIHPSALKVLHDGLHHVEALTGALDGEELKRKIADVHFVGIRSRTQLTADVFAAAQKLVAVGCFCIGTNQVDLNAARERGVVVFNAPYSNTRSVAELVLGEAICRCAASPKRMPSPTAAAGRRARRIPSRSAARRWASSAMAPSAPSCRCWPKAWA